MQPLTHLLISLPGHPASCEGLDGDGGDEDQLVELSHAITSPVSLDDHRGPGLLQCGGAHRLTAGKVQAEHKQLDGGRFSLTVKPPASARYCVAPCW